MLCGEVVKSIEILSMTFKIHKLLPNFEKMYSSLCSLIINVHFSIAAPKCWCYFIYESQTQNHELLIFPNDHCSLDCVSLLSNPKCLKIQNIFAKLCVT